MTPSIKSDFSKEYEEFVFRQQPKPGRRVIWNSYSKGTYIKALHGPIGSKTER